MQMRINLIKYKKKTLKKKKEMNENSQRHQPEQDDRESCLPCLALFDDDTKRTIFIKKNPTDPPTKLRK